jgi:DNA-binding transcriptional ArsR family regulator
MQETLRRFKADIFQALAQSTRIAIIELLGHEELSAGALIAQLGMEQANVSQHLEILRAKQLVSNRKVGNQVFYTVRDPFILPVVQLVRTYFHAHLKDAIEMLDEMETPLDLCPPVSPGKAVSRVKAAKMARKNRERSAQ